MTELGAWEVGDDELPGRLSSDRHFLEKNLETWIQNDPSMLGGNVRWASRQLELPDRSRLDLLGLTNDGTWVIVELKAGPVLTNTVLQALHYLLQIETLDDAELVRRVRRKGVIDAAVDSDLELLAGADGPTVRDYEVVVAGVGGAESASSAVEILGKFGFTVPIRVVRFDLFTAADGRRILLREVDNESPQGGARREPWTLDAVLQLADDRGVGETFRAIHAALTARGYRVSVKKWGLNYNLGTRSQVFWIKPNEDHVHAGYLSSNFPSLFGVDETEAAARMGQNWRDLTKVEAVAQIEQWAAVIDELAGDSAPEAQE